MGVGRFLGDDFRSLCRMFGREKISAYNRTPIERKDTMSLKKYQYGSDPKHVVMLTENQARATNEGLFYPDGNEERDGNSTLISGTFRLPDGVTVDDYNSAANILNGYIASQGGTIPCSQEYLNDHPILTEITD